MKEIFDWILSRVKNTAITGNFLEVENLASTYAKQKSLHGPDHEAAVNYVLEHYDFNTPEYELVIGQTVITVSDLPKILKITITSSPPCIHQWHPAFSFSVLKEDLEHKRAKVGRMIFDEFMTSCNWKLIAWVLAYVLYTMVKSGKLEKLYDPGKE